MAKVDVLDVRISQLEKGEKENSENEYHALGKKFFEEHKAWFLAKYGE
jgi:hypothetical protein